VALASVGTLRKKSITFKLFFFNLYSTHNLVDASGMFRASEEPSAALIDVQARLPAIIHGVVVGEVAMGVGAIEANGTRAALEARTKIGARRQLVARIVEQALIHIPAAGSVHLVAHWTRDAVKVGRIANLEALGAFVKLKSNCKNELR